MKPAKTSKKNIKLLIPITAGFIASFLLLEFLLFAGGLFLDNWPKKPFVSNSDGELIKILCVGESMTRVGAGNSWPSQLEFMLNSSGPKNDNAKKKKFKVINEAVVGRQSTTGYFVNEIERLLSVHKPNAVIPLIGINDILSSQVMLEDHINGIKPRIIRTLRWSRVFRLLDEIVFHARAATIDNRINAFGNFWLRCKIRYSSWKMQDRIKIFEQIMNKKPENSKQVYKDLALKLYYMELYSDLEHISNLYLKKSPESPLANMFKNVCLYQVDPLSYKQALIKSAEHNNAYKWIPWHQILKLELYQLHDIESASKTMREYVSTVFDSDSETSLKKNYHQFISKILKCDIPVIILQYPLLPIELLENMILNNSADFIQQHQNKIHFISLEKDFELALKSHSYKDLFLDQFGILFGHCTSEGNRIIAEKISKVVTGEKLL